MSDNARQRFHSVKSTVPVPGFSMKDAPMPVTMVTSTRVMSGRYDGRPVPKTPTPWNISGMSPPLLFAKVFLSRYTAYRFFYCLVFSSPGPSGSQGGLIVYPCSGVRRPQCSTSSPLKPLGQSKPNFMWSLLGKGERKFM